MDFEILSIGDAWGIHFSQNIFFIIRKLIRFYMYIISPEYT